MSIRVALCLLAAVLVTPPVRAADMRKTLHVVLQNGETTLDPAQASDTNTLALIENIYDAPLRYDYLARPLQLRPNLLRAMPSISADGLTYLLQLRDDVRFTPDRAFGGATLRGRAMTAEDLAYSIRRHYDPAIKSAWLFLLEGKLQGDAALRRTPFDPSLAIAGLQVVDRTTLRIVLNRPDHNFLFILAMPALSVVAREVIEAQRPEPVGSGPYLLREWQRNTHLVLEANPDFRPVSFDDSTGANPTIARALQGQRLPLIGRIDVRVIEEQQARVLGFLHGDFDMLDPVPPPLSGLLLEQGRLKSELAQRGIGLTLLPMMELDYLWFNMDDPLVGGMDLAHIALRRAIALVYPRDEDIAMLAHGLALPARSPVPPNVRGHDPAAAAVAPPDPDLARALLNHFGFRDHNGDGWRTRPDGQALTLTMHSVASTTGRLRDELWRRALQQIGIRVVFNNGKFADLLKAARLGQVQMMDAEWIGDFPDGENFYQLLYGPNSGSANRARFKLPAYDRLFEQAATLADSPARDALYRQMDQLILGYAPWVMRSTPLWAIVHQPWVHNFVRHPVANTTWRYLDLDPARR